MAGVSDVLAWLTQQTHMWLWHGSLSTHSKANKSLAALLEGHRRKAAFLVRNESLIVCEDLKGRMTTTLIHKC
jgi:hypothetical protein